MTRDEFLYSIRTADPAQLCAEFLQADTIAAFGTADAYASFRERVHQLVADVEAVYVAGSGNWGFSLNPNKGFKAFDEMSDVDLAIVSSTRFHEAWNALREFHRRSWYLLDGAQKERLRRNGENVYAGFVSPAWIPEKGSLLRFDFLRSLNKLSDDSVAFRRVSAVYFKSVEEATDYYRRGFIIARSRMAQ